MIGRRVRPLGLDTRGPGTVERWEPLGAAMCDALVLHDDGQRCWHSSTGGLAAIDDLGPLPSRREAQEANRVRMLADLESIRAQHVAGFHERWPGLEHGKALVGQMLDGAIADVKAGR